MTHVSQRKSPLKISIVNKIKIVCEKGWIRTANYECHIADAFYLAPLLDIVSA